MDELRCVHFCHTNMDFAEQKRDDHDGSYKLQVEHHHDSVDNNVEMTKSDGDSATSRTSTSVVKKEIRTTPAHLSKLTQGYINHSVDLNCETSILNTQSHHHHDHSLHWHKHSVSDITDAGHNESVSNIKEK